MMDRPAFHAYFASQHALHDPPDSNETAARASVLLDALRVRPSWAIMPAQDHGLAPILAVHTHELIAFLQTAYTRFAQLQLSPRPAIGDCFAVRALVGRRPQNVLGELGYYCSDSLTPILAHTWDAAYWSAQTALSAAQSIIEGVPQTYALCRPPGHHAHADVIGGYCYLNNAAIAAEWLTLRNRRVAIVDTDYHHGNGTQAIFYHRPDVLVVSVHADPAEEYPYFCGYADETGEGEGTGLNANFPLPLGAGEAQYLAALDDALAAVDRFAPDVLLVSHGFDTLAGDPDGGFRLAESSFDRIGQRLRAFGRPLLVIQEGGYLLHSLGGAMTAFLDGLASP